MKKLLLALASALILIECKKSEHQSVLATITTTPVSTVNPTTATSGGSITSDGGAPITERGICYNTTGAPTVSADQKVISGSGTGNFTATMYDLTTGRNYYVRAYAINSVGVAYGNELNFSTPYEEVTIGTQTWMLKNLDVSHYSNGDSIPQVEDSAKWANLSTGAWCWYKNDSANGAVYGKLYNWYAVHDPRGLAPTGWHVPSDAEWDILSTFLGGDSVAGGKLKETGTIQAGTGLWYAPNTGATNTSGFTGLPGGYRATNGACFFLGHYGFWWSFTQASGHGAWGRSLTYYFPDIYTKIFDNQDGFSVRCLRD